MRRRVVSATESATSASITRDDMIGYKAYYFLAPSEYLGKRYVSYLGRPYSIVAEYHLAELINHNAYHANHNSHHINHNAHHIHHNGRSPGFSG